MSDDFGTVSVRREDRAREIEVMRQRYRAHRETLQRLAADAPTDALATEYTRLVGEVDKGLAKLDELEGPGGAMPPSPPPPPRTTNAGDRPLASAPSYADPTPAPNPASRVVIIVIAGLIVLGAIVYLIWRGSEKKGAAGRIVEQPAATAPADTASPSTAPATTQTTPVAAAATTLKVTPLIADYGAIRKGTRAVRQFDVVNNSATPITLVVSRSSCRCLFYEYNGKTKVAPKGKERITVTVDGGKAPAGNLRETLAVTAKEDSSVTGEFTVQAVIR